MQKLKNNEARPKFTVSYKKKRVSVDRSLNRCIFRLKTGGFVALIVCKDCSGEIFGA